MPEPSETLRCIFEVTAGLIPNQPLPEYTRRFTLMDSDTDSEVYRDKSWLQQQGAAMIYALSLQDPSRVNWVRLDWIWL